MSGELLGMNVGAARALAARLERWPREVDHAISLIAEAELLSDLAVYAIGVLDSIGGDGSTMAAAIRRAADALESFTISLDTPMTIAAAVAHVHRFRGSDNDPELDARLRTLRTLVDARTSSPAEAALVMSQMLAADRSIDVRFRDTRQVDEAKAEVERLGDLEATGAISSNDPRIDQAVRALGTALAAHADSQEQASELLAGFVSPSARGVATATLLASTLTRRPLEVVRVAHANGLDYEVAAAVIGLDRVDELTRLIDGSPVAAMERRAAERRDLLAELAETDDPRVIAGLTDQLADGVPAIDAFAGLDAHLEARAEAHAEAVHVAQVEAVAELLGLGYDDAEVRLAELTDRSAGLLDGGWSRVDVSKAVLVAAGAGLDLDTVETLAVDQQMSLVAAAAKLVEADMHAMTVGELDAYRALREHFAVLDTARGGSPDGIVSIWDLGHVQQNPDRFAPEVVAAAAAVAAAPGMRNRLDSARDDGDVIGHEAFGEDRADDHKYSASDIVAFEQKQSVNYVLRNHVDAIDVATLGDDRLEVDGTLGKANFQAYLANAEELGLDEQTQAAIQVVIDADWYDQDFWQRHGDTMVYLAGAVAGGAVIALSAGTAGGVVLTLWATAAGAGTGAAITLTENALTGDPLGEDLLTHTLVGATGGVAGSGLAMGIGSVPTSTAGRAATALGRGADVAGFVASGAADPVLELVFDDSTIGDIHDGAQQINYFAGVGSVALYGVAAQGAQSAAAQAAQDLAVEAAEREALQSWAGSAIDDRNLAATQRIVGRALDDLGVDPPLVPAAGR